MIGLFESNPIIPIVITLIAYIISYTIYIKTKLPILTPLVTTVILVGFSLYFMRVPYSVYNESGGKFINALVGPATVVLALPIYRNLPILKANLPVILISIAIGSAIGIIGIFIISKALGISDNILLSLLPKSVTRYFCKYWRNKINNGFVGNNIGYNGRNSRSVYL